MSPFIIGLLAGLVAAIALTAAYHRLRGTAALSVLLITIFVSMLPRLYFSLGAYQGSPADFEYISAWMLVVAPGFLLGYSYLGRFFKKKSGK